VAERGVVYLVGAGPGDPGLLTRRGEALLRAADVVVYDRLVSDETLAICPPGVERVYVGKGPGQQAASQEQINQLLVRLAGKGRMVVRLKGGDPFIFGRGGEEALALRAAGHRFEVVPGVSSAIAGPAYAGIPVTHRGLSTSVTIATGHEDPTKPGARVDWARLGRSAETLVVLMGVEQLDTIADDLMASGRPAGEPTALVRWATTGRQAVLRATLATIAERARSEAFGPPSVLVVGAVVGLAEQLDWVSARPLQGRRVLVTRAREQVSALADRLAALGAEPIEFPAIVVRPLEDTAELDQAIGRLGEYNWVVFTSANGVRATFDRLVDLGRDARAFGRARVAVIGPATAAALAERGIRADFVPATFSSEAVLGEIAPLVESDHSVLLLRADIAPKDLKLGLAGRAGRVDDVTAYRTEPDVSDHEQVERLLAERQIDVVTFTSSSTVCNLVAALGGNTELLTGTTIACIGPVTAQTARELGLDVGLIAPVHTIEGLVESLAEAFRPAKCSREAAS
jgi:uroporphyrinogen III methyltransferase/synthase